MLVWDGIAGLSFEVVAKSAALVFSFSPFCLEIQQFREELSISKVKFHIKLNTNFSSDLPLVSLVHYFSLLLVG